MVQFNSSVGRKAQGATTERRSVQIWSWRSFSRDKSYDNRKVRFSVTRGTEGRVMAIKRQPSFDPKSFLAKVGEGRSIEGYHKDQIVFSQPADAVFYVERGEVKVTVVSKQGKEAVVAILGTNQFFGKDVLPGRRSA